MGENWRDKRSENLALRRAVADWLDLAGGLANIRRSPLLGERSDDGEKGERTASMVDDAEEMGVEATIANGL